MHLLFAVCAVLGGTILVLQFLLSLLGLGGHHDFGGDAGHDFGGDAHGGDMHADGTHDSHSGHADHHDSNLFFRMLSFRAVVAALAFFGLAGLAGQSAHLTAPVTLVIALGAGFAAMYGVYWMMRGLNSLQVEGTARIERSVGKVGRVYLRVPANESESGKIQVNLQNRTMEYLATTTGPEIPTGAEVEVVGVISPTTVSVRAVNGENNE
jgi:membrane protein implicated in regulation of membrane protease activity